MTNKERGFLLLTGHLGNPERRPLTVAQFRTLAQRAMQMDTPLESRDLQESDLVALGYDRISAQRILVLLSEEELLDRYLYKGHRQGCLPITRITEAYPASVRKRLDLDAPGCLWAKGDVSLLENPAICLVGSRQLGNANRIFAETVGREVALQGYILVSGNARGADIVAQDACLEAGGKVISVVADSLEDYSVQKNILYLSEDAFDEAFSAQRALSRNRVIHTLGCIAIVAQCSYAKGGTWDGTVKNLQKNWSPVFCFDDGSQGAKELAHRGAKLIDIHQLSKLSELRPDTQSFL
ncbi:MAG: DNA-processing protein DprA [Oscillospiraceae bacterium]|nr:DNA-processing protein DprA [Oscillospiraceae bacterium]